MPPRRRESRPVPSRAANPKNTTTNTLESADNWIVVQGAGRCTRCSHHVATQGHRDGCDGSAPVTPEADPEWENLSFYDRLVRHTADDPDFYSHCSAQIQRRADQIHAWLDGKSPGPEPSNGVGQFKPTATAAPGTKPGYVRKAIADELAALAATREGSRNHTLNIVACKVFGYCKTGHADRQAVWDALKQIGLDIGLTSHEIEGTLSSAWTAAKPRHIPAHGVVEVTANQLRKPAA